ncbi:hypothetical protein N7492_006946 [Penicillium capsulatum]|uniref:Uncharacterized protein n=1 Tax=Penicillium capsulatum TaxID=69766 RepID=A0A9W9LL73_9EURO|nr:hypothetical protein N7492_006946 [Penicillium capsulatum]KAJ6116779.1 hypothetical protein N7512_006504 [Penicillium capsulatum]
MRFELSFFLALVTSTAAKFTLYEYEDGSCTHGLFKTIGAQNTAPCTPFDSGAHPYSVQASIGSDNYHVYLYYNTDCSDSETEINNGECSAGTHDTPFAAYKVLVDA